MAEKEKPKFTKVNLRLFTEDVEEAKRRAEAGEGSGDFQAILRLAVKAAMRKKRGMR